MPWRDALHPVTMQRVALLAPRDALRQVLVFVADDGTVAMDDPPTGPDGTTSPPPAVARLRALPTGGAITPALSLSVPDLDRCEQAGRVDLIAGEAEV